MLPKPIRIRYKTANGRKMEMTIPDVVYLSIEDLHREVSNKPVFVIDLDTSWKQHDDTKVR